MLTLLKKTHIKIIIFIILTSQIALSAPKDDYVTLANLWETKEMDLLKNKILAKEAAANLPLTESVKLMKAFRLWFFEGDLNGAKTIYDSLPTIELDHVDPTEDEENRTAYIHLIRELLDFEIKLRNKAIADGKVIPAPDPLIVRNKVEIEPPALSIIELATD